MNQGAQSLSRDEDRPLEKPRETISPSQADTFATCPRKWAWRYLDDVKEPEKASTQVGQRVHKIIEDWLLHGIPPNPGEESTFTDADGTEKTYRTGLIAYNGLEHQPPHTAEYDVETPFVCGLWDGRLDLTYEIAVEVPFEIVQSGQVKVSYATTAWFRDDHWDVRFDEQSRKFVRRIPVVHDHKTSTDPAKWGKSPDDLRKDVQALVYAQAALRASGADCVELRWLYHQTRHPYKIIPVSLRLTRAEVEENIKVWDEIALTVMRVKELAERSNVPKGRRALQLAPNPSACQKFGGCFYVRFCELSSEELMRGLFMTDMSLLQKLDQMVGSAPAPAPAVSAPVIAPTAIDDWQPHPDNPTQYEFSMKANGGKGAVRGLAGAHNIDAIKALYFEGKNSLEISTKLELSPASTAAMLAQHGGPWTIELHSMRQSPNPPEEPKTLLTGLPGTPGSSEEDDEDESKVGDQFDDMDKPKLKSFIELHNLNVDLGRLKEKKSRILVRAAWADRQVALANPALAKETQARLEAEQKAKEQVQSQPYSSPDMIITTASGPMTLGAIAKGRLVEGTTVETVSATYHLDPLVVAKLVAEVAAEKLVAAPAQAPSIPQPPAPSVPLLPPSVPLAPTIPVPPTAVAVQAAALVVPPTPPPAPFQVAPPLVPTVSAPQLPIPSVPTPPPPPPPPPAIVQSEASAAPPLPPLPAIPVVAPVVPSPPAVPPAVPSLPSVQVPPAPSQEMSPQSHALLASVLPQGSQLSAPPSTVPVVHPPTGFVLFVNCVPTKWAGKVMGVREAFGPAFEEAANGPEGLGHDYRLVAYGKGGGILSAAVRLLHVKRPMEKHTAVTVSSSSAEGSALLETLVELADEVVIGF